MKSKPNCALVLHDHELTFRLWARVSVRLSTLTDIYSADSSCWSAQGFPSMEVLMNVVFDMLKGLEQKENCCLPRPQAGPHEKIMGSVTGFIRPKIRVKIPASNGQGLDTGGPRM